jgi:hypothetical protein
VVYRTLHHFSLACAACAVAAAIGQRKTVIQCGFQYGLVCVNWESVIAGVYGSFEAHEYFRFDEGRDFNA